MTTFVPAPIGLSSQFGLRLGLSLKPNVYENFLNVLYKKKNYQNNRINFRLKNIFVNAENELNKNKQRVENIKVKSAFGKVYILNQRFIVKEFSRSERCMEHLVEKEQNNVKFINDLRGEVEEFIIKQFYELTEKKLFLVSKNLLYEGYISLETYFNENPKNNNNERTKNIYYSIFNKIKRGIELLFMNGIIHNDLHSNNVFIKIEPNGNIFIKFIDYGLCTLRNSQEYENEFGNEFFRCKILFFSRMMKYITLFKMMDYLDLILTNEYMKPLYFEQINLILSQPNMRANRSQTPLPYYNGNRREERSGTVTSMNEGFLECNKLYSRSLNNEALASSVRTNSARTVNNRALSTRTVNNRRALSALSVLNESRRTPVNEGEEQRLGLFTERVVSNEGVLRPTPKRMNSSNVKKNEKLIYDNIIDIMKKPKVYIGSYPLIDKIYNNKNEIIPIILNPMIGVGSLESIPINRRTVENSNNYEQLMKIQTLIRECNERFTFETIASSTPNPIIDWIISNNN